MSALDDKINEHFSGLVVRKDLVKTVKGNAIVPSYVLEYLLGQYCATSDEASIQTGIETVKEILKKHFVQRNEAGLVRSTIRERGRHKVIDKISVELNTTSDAYEASFSNLGIKKVIVETTTIKKHPKLLVGGVWCLADLEYEHTEEKGHVPWQLASLKPIQMSGFDSAQYLAARAQFTAEEWLDVLVQSMGFNPEILSRRNKLLQVVRLIPYCERNYNMIELGPKGTGKSHIYSEFSPHGILISGGEVTVPKLFVNNASGKIGLVGYWDVVAFDEFAGKKKKAQKALVDIMKNYMANKTFSRGIETLGAEASMAFMGNTKRSLAYMLKHSDLFDELPEAYYDSAFLDRMHFYLPGWEVDVIRGEMFSSGYGFIVDYLAEILRTMRNEDFSQAYRPHFTLDSDISTRDRDAIHKTFSGLIKILFPGENASREEMEELLVFAVEGRKRVKSQLVKIDETYPPVNFAYSRTGEDESVPVQMLEERQFPGLFQELQVADGSAGEAAAAEPSPAAPETPALESGKHLEIAENQRGISFRRLFADYFRGATRITIADTYVRNFHQVRNLMELIEVIFLVKEDGEDVEVSLLTTSDHDHPESQDGLLMQLVSNLEGSGVDFSYKYDNCETMHGRSICTDTGWKIVLDRGLDIFQPFDSKDRFNPQHTVQELRPCRSFYVTYLRQEDTSNAPV